MAKTRKDKRGRELVEARRGRREIVVATRAERLDEGRQVALGVKVDDSGDKPAAADAQADDSGGAKGRKSS